jgi:signal transduction histidine kinase
MIFLIIFPFLVILISLYQFNHCNKNQIKSKFEDISNAEGITIRNLMEVAGSHLAGEGEEALLKFLDSLYQNESILYIGLFKGDRLHYLTSRFEGYFPISKEQLTGGVRIIDSPGGKIQEIMGRFSHGSSSPFRLYIGFNYEFLTAFERAAGSNFLLVAALFSVIMLFVIGLALYFDKKFFGKELELVREKQQKERFKELSLLTSEIAHEIKNPLNSIYLSFNALEPFLSSEPDARYYRDAVKGEIKRIANIINSYSDLSSEVRPVIGDVDIDDFFREFNLLLKEELRQHHIEPELEVEKDLVFKTDRNILKQSLLNLFKNAIEAGADRIQLHCRRQGKHLSITINDNGRGIPDDMKADIFKPYISGKTRGMGLGLHITKKLIRSLDGEIQLVSSAPGNTTFQIILAEG